MTLFVEWKCFMFTVIEPNACGLIIELFVPACVNHFTRELLLNQDHDQCLKSKHTWFLLYISNSWLIMLDVFNDGVSEMNMFVCSQLLNHMVTCDSSVQQLWGQWPINLASLTIYLNHPGVFWYPDWYIISCTLHLCLNPWVIYRLFRIP